MSHFLYSLYTEGMHSFIFKIGYPIYNILYEDEDNTYTFPIEVLVYNRCAKVKYMPRIIKQTSCFPSGIWYFLFLNEGFINLKQHPQKNKWKVLLQTLQCLRDCYELGVYHTALNISHLYLTMDGEVCVMG